MYITEQFMSSHLDGIAAHPNVIRRYLWMVIGNPDIGLLPSPKSVLHGLCKLCMIRHKTRTTSHYTVFLTDYTHWTNTHSCLWSFNVISSINWGCLSRMQPHFGSIDRALSRFGAMGVRTPVIGETLYPFSIARSSSRDMRGMPS